MIFKIQTRLIESIMHYGWYQPNRNGNNLKYRFDQMVNRLKLKRPEAIEYYTRKLGEIFDGGFVICIVPSHKPSNVETGIKVLADKLIENLDIIDGTSCLIRTKEIPALGKGGDRSELAQYSSMAVVHAHLIRGKEVLLLDDITTTGNSLNVGRELLLKNGAKIVQSFALTKTVGGYY